MFVILWEFDVKPGYERRFESVYGPSGDWVQLFRRDASYQRTLLLRDPFREHTYLTCDFWENRKAYDSFQQNKPVEYFALDKACDEMTSAERKIGDFERISTGE